MKGHTWTQVQWGVLFREDENFRKAGSVEYSGTRPGGDVGSFSESECRYIASGSPNRAVVRRIVVHSRTEFDWAEV